MSEFQKCKLMAEKTKQDMKSKDLQMRKMEETMHGLDLKIKEKDQKNKNLQDKVKELEAQLLVERKLARQHVDARIAEQLQQQQMKTESEEAVEVSSAATTHEKRWYQSRDGESQGIDRKSRKDGGTQGVARQW